MLVMMNVSKVSEFKTAIIKIVCNVLRTRPELNIVSFLRQKLKEPMQLNLNNAELLSHVHNCSIYFSYFS